MFTLQTKNPCKYLIYKGFGVVFVTSSGFKPETSTAVM